MSRRRAPLVSSPSTPAPAKRTPFTRRLVKAILAPYMRLYHGLEFQGAEHLPPRGPAIVVLNHGILLDVGPAFRFEPGTDAADAAERIRREIAALLPPEMQP